MIRQIVLPGEKVDARDRQDTYTDHGTVYSKVVGLYDKQGGTIIPLEGAYVPHIGDDIVGIINSERNGVYDIDIQHFDRCLLISDRHEELMERGEVISATIRDIENKNTLIVEMPRMLNGGVLIHIKPTKIPRVIGKNDTMARMISTNTGTRIVVGMNGLIWLSGGDVTHAIEALLRVEREAHVEGLTNRIKIMLEEWKNSTQG
ncbi:MAG: KH domain-containing protein [Candidatus Micrarchaeia archaeon]